LDIVYPEVEHIVSLLVPIKTEW